MRGLEIARLRLELDLLPRGSAEGGTRIADRRARAEALADGILSLRQAVERATLT